MQLQKKQVIIYGSLFLAVILLFGGSLWFFLGKKAPAPKKFGYQALKINGEFVSPAIFLEEQNKFYLRYKSNSEIIRKTDEERNDLLLEEIINRIGMEDFLLKESNLNISPDEIEEYINRYIKTKYSTPLDMKFYLDSVYCSNLTDLERMVKIYLLKVKYFSKLARENGISVSAAEVEKEYQLQKDQNIKAVFKHILISIQKHPPQEALKLANQVYDQLKNGSEFEQLAKQYSEDQDTKNQGGVLPPATKEEVPPEFVKTIFNAKPGQLIPPFDTEFGYEIVKLEKLITFIHPREELQETMLMEEFGKTKQFSQWLTGVKSKLKIEVIEPSLKAFRLFKDQKFGLAAPVYKKAYQMTSVELYFLKSVQCYRLAQDWDKMLELCQRGYKRFSDKIPYYLDAAEALTHKGQQTEALKLLKKAEDFARDNSYLQDLVSQAYTRLGLKK